MSHLKRIPAALVSVLLVLCGLTAALVGVYLRTDMAVTLIVGGATAVVVGLIVDLG